MLLVEMTFFFEITITSIYITRSKSQYGINHDFAYGQSGVVCSLQTASGTVARDYWEPDCLSFGTGEELTAAAAADDSNHRMRRQNLLNTRPES